MLASSFEPTFNSCGLEDKMSSRPSIPITASLSNQPSKFYDITTWSARRVILQNIHDAAQIGDVSNVKQIFDNYTDLNIDITRKGRNTTLHTALLHNQEGPLIDYLISKGADINAENAKGHTPLTLAIVYCDGGRREKAVEKLINAGAKYDTTFESGVFVGMSLMDVSVKYKNKHAINLLKRLEDEKKNPTLLCQEVSIATKDKNKYRAVCPICNLLVTYPTKMSRIETDQAMIEERIKHNGDRDTSGSGKTRRKKYISRKYMDQLLSHSNGEAYKKLCGIEYHGVENMRLRKEISESFGVLHAVQSCCRSLGIENSSTSTDNNDNINFENICLIDLCSGKGITTALCGVMDRGEGSNNYFLAIDRMLPHTIPHFLNKGRVHYLCRDVMTQQMFTEVAAVVSEQTHEHGRACILVGMHLCGLLSTRAIELFEQTPDIKGIVLSPCCLPKKHQQKSIGFEKEKPTGDDVSVELFQYFKWAGYLKKRAEEVSAVSDVKMYKDDEMHTERSAIIVGMK